MFYLSVLTLCFYCISFCHTYNNRENYFNDEYNEPKYRYTFKEEENEDVVSGENLQNINDLYEIGYKQRLAQNLYDEDFYSSNNYERGIDTTEDEPRYNVDENDAYLDNIDRTILYKKSEKCISKKMYRYSKTDVKLVIDTLDRMLMFYNKYYNRVIVDGLFGVRSAQGSVEIAFQLIKPDHWLYESLKKLKEHFRIIAKRIYGSVQKKTDKYSQAFLPILDRPFKYLRPYKNYKQSLVWKHFQTGLEFSEAESDRCICLLLGTEKASKKCVVEKKCLKTETQRFTKDYYLTHQVLYFISGETHGCHDNITKKIGGQAKLDQQYELFGSNIYSQMVRKNIKNPHDRDIIAEQGMVGQSLGIVECFRMDYLREMLNWVDKDGCVKVDSELGGTRKRVDNMIGSCSQHETSVVMGYLSAHLKFIVDPPPCHMIS